ncbi:MAG: hypothetical protein E4G90_11615, partial [Gemmatimonadales bacterium]
GLSTWTNEVVLAWEGVRFGITDPALNYDVGFYVARLPLLLKTHALGTILVVGTIGITLPVHLLIGSIRVGRGVTAIAPPARRQVRLLATALALLLAGHQVLLPLQLAAGLPHPVAPDLVLLYRSVSFVLVGVALAVTALSLIWSWRPIHSLVAGAWVAFTLALVLTFWLLPSGGEWPASDTDRLRQGPFESLAYGFVDDTAANPEVSGLSLWDGVPLGAFESGPVGGVANGGGDETGRAAWVRVEPLPDGGVSVSVTRGDTADSFGRPVLSWSRLLPASAAYPGAAELVLFEGASGGTSLGGLPKRLALAWALQSWGIVNREGSALRAAWYRDPRVRLSRLAPIALWRHPQLLLIDGMPTWVVNGVLVSESFPVANRRSWAGRRVSYARAGLVGLVRAFDGATAVFLAPEADSLAHVVARISSGLIQPTWALPAEARDMLAYEPELFALHAGMWSEREGRRLGLDTNVVGSLTPVVGWGSGPRARQTGVVHHRTGRVLGILEGRRTLEGHKVAVYRPDSVGLEPPDVLSRRWQRLPEVQLLSDSVMATAGSFEPAQVRYGSWNGGLIAYQPLFAVAQTEEVRLVGVAIALGNRIGMGRTLLDAQRQVSADGVEVTPGPGESDRWFEARRWLQVADSALARGDLVTFGRAFAALRRALQRD